MLNTRSDLLICYTVDVLVSDCCWENKSLDVMCTASDGAIELIWREIVRQKQIVPSACGVHGELLSLLLGPDVMQLLNWQLLLKSQPFLLCTHFTAVLTLNRRRLSWTVHLLMGFRCSLWWFCRAERQLVDRCLVSANPSKRKKADGAFSLWLFLCRIVYFLFENFVEFLGIWLTVP